MFVHRYDVYKFTGTDLVDLLNAKCKKADANGVIQSVGYIVKFEESGSTTAAYNDADVYCS